MSGPKGHPINHPAPDLSFNTTRIDAGTQIHRIHHTDYRANGFNPGAPIDLKAVKVGSRFAPIRAGGDFIPTLYGGSSLGCAAYETIFHDIDPAELFKTVPMSALSSLRYSVVALEEDIEVTRLFTPDLKKLKLERTDLIDSPASTYPQTRPWAEAIHASPAEPAGMIWTSRQFDEDRAYVLFGTRLDEARLRVTKSVKIVEDPDTLDAVRELGELGDITIVHS